MAGFVFLVLAQAVTVLITLGLVALAAWMV